MEMRVEETGVKRRLGGRQMESFKEDLREKGLERNKYVNRGKGRCLIRNVDPA